MRISIPPSSFPAENRILEGAKGQQPQPQPTRTMDWIFAGLAFGFLGSFHCVGMCGPLALSLPGSLRYSPRFLGHRLVYNGGRVITYSALGVAAGLLSRAVTLGGFQQGLSIAVGGGILLALASRAVRKRVNRWKSLPGRWVARASRPVKKLFREEGTLSMLAIGLLNGLLPCGFVYMALLTAVTFGSVEAGGFFMAGFGLGTVPAMLGVSMAGTLISADLRRRLQQLSPWFIGAVGLLLVLRGLELGIPFVSPVY